MLGCAALLASAAFAGCGGEAAARVPIDPDAAALHHDGPDAGDAGPAQLTARVSGLVGHGLVLRSAAGEERAVSADGSITFSQPLTPGADALTVASQPSAPSQTCSVRVVGGSIAVSCETNAFRLGGSVIGLAGAGLTLEDARGERLVVTASGPFQFGAPLADLAPYAVRVVSTPTQPRQHCSVEGGEGEVAGADVSAVTVSCTTERFGISGSVSGLRGSGLTLELTSAESLAIRADGPFGFSASLPDGSAFAVNVTAQPRGPDQQCVVLGGHGSLDGEAIRDVAVVCGAQGGLRISEVGSCHFADSACWLELYNAGSAVEDLSYYQLRTPAARREPPYTIASERTFALPSFAVAPGAYVVVQAASSGALPDGQGVVHVRDGDELPWWAESGFVELLTANRTIDFVRFGGSSVAPTTTRAWSAGSAPELPSGPNAYGYALARGAQTADSDGAQDWAVRAFATPGGQNDVSSDADVDTDGVPDSAELPGGTFAGLDLYAMGARIGPRDLFVEIDRMQSSDPAVSPRREALDSVVSAFAARNIALHFDAGSLFSAQFNPASYNLGGGDVVPFATAVAIGPSEEGFADLYEYKAAHMAAARRSLFYYLLFAWSQEEDGSGGSSGVGERPGNDSLVSLGGWDLDTSTTTRRNLLINYQAATIMHELGHNLGLRHGGGDDLNYKPNYVSVMNYLYSPLGLPTIGMSEGDRYDLYRRCSLFSVFQLSNAPTGDPNKFLIDFSSGLSADVSELELAEADGLGRVDSKAVDYNCNRRIDAAYARDLNGDERKDVLQDHDDWASLDFVFRRSFSGNENGPGLWFWSVAEPVHEDVLTHDVQPIDEPPCLPPAG